MWWNSVTESLPVMHWKPWVLQLVLERSAGFLLVHPFLIWLHRESVKVVLAQWFVKVHSTFFFKPPITSCLYLNSLVIFCNFLTTVSRLCNLDPDFGIDEMLYYSLKSCIKHNKLFFWDVVCRLIIFSC